MSTFFMPHELMPEMKEVQAQLDKMNRDVAALLPREMTGAANMMAHPVAATAAFAAVGVGMAGHAFGLWMGAVAGSADAAQKMASLAFSGFEPLTPVRPVAKAPAARAKAAVRTLLADTESGIRAAVAPEARVVETPAPVVAPEKAADGPTDPVDAVEADAEPVVETIEAVTDAVSATIVEASQPRAMERPEMVDDLKAISGVGPKLEKVLNGLGIWSYGQIAALTAGEVLWLDEHLGFRGRIGRDGWIEQATRLQETPR